MKKIFILLSISFVFLFHLAHKSNNDIEIKNDEHPKVQNIKSICNKNVCENYHNKDFNIPTESMFPLFKVGGQYNFESTTQFTEINRFDVIAFKFNVGKRFPTFEIRKNCEPNINIDKKCAINNVIHYTKRVVGLPNDTIQMVQGRLKINGVLSKYTKVKMSDNIINLGEEVLKLKDKKGGFKYYIEKYNNSEHIIAMAEKYSNKSSNTEPYVLGENEYFLMGDNRVFSSDSRVFGIINKEDITYIYHSEQNPLNTIDYTIIPKNK